MKLRYKCIFVWITFIFLFSLSSVSFATDNLVINSEACILIDADYDKILYEKNANKRLYPASTTKVMTAILTCEKCNLQDKVTVSYWAVNSVPNTYSIGNIIPGEVFTVEELLNITMIASANDAAFVLAEYIANLDNANYLKDSSNEAKDYFNKSINTFSEMMNSKAKEIGCLETNFVNPNGIHNENHYSTAYDLALIGQYAYSNPIIKNICSKRTYELPSTNPDIGTNKYKNTNALLWQSDNSKYYYSYANGLKTGFTDPAGYCIIATASKDNMNLLAVVLKGFYLEDGTATRENDCINLFNYGFEHFTTTDLVNEGDVVRTINVFNGTDDTKSLDLICVNNLDCIIEKGGVIDATPKINLSNVLAPIANGQVVGTITYTINGTDYSSDLIASHDVYSSSVMNIIIILFVIFIILLISVIILCFRKEQ